MKGFVYGWEVDIKWLILSRDPEHERAWLIVTARNECRDQLKHWWRRCREDASALDALVWEEPRDGLPRLNQPGAHGGGIFPQQTGDLVGGGSSWCIRFAWC